jgi:hypothetical protein
MRITAFRLSCEFFDKYAPVSESQCNYLIGQFQFIYTGGRNSFLRKMELIVGQSIMASWPRRLSIRPVKARPIIQSASSGLALRAALGLWAVVLLAAAILKAYDLWQYDKTLLGSRPLAVVVIILEVVLAGCIALDRRIVRARVVGITVFCCFALTAFAKAILGHTSCACFGPIDVNPWYTLALDLTAVASLVLFGSGLPHFTAKRVAILSAIAGLLVVVAFGAVIRGKASRTGRQESAMLKPKEWIGTQLPILGQIDIGNQLGNGNWIVVLVHRDCPMCRRAVVRSMQLTHQFGISLSDWCVAVVEISGRGPDTAGIPTISSDSPILGRVSRDVKWSVTTPVVLWVVDGIVRKHCDSAIASQGKFATSDISHSLPSSQRPFEVHGARCSPCLTTILNSVLHYQRELAYARVFAFRVFRSSGPLCYF